MELRGDVEGWTPINMPNLTKSGVSLNVARRIYSAILLPSKKPSPVKFGCPVDLKIKEHLRPNIVNEEAEY